MSAARDDVPLARLGLAGRGIEIAPQLVALLDPHTVPPPMGLSPQLIADIEHCTSMGFPRADALAWLRSGVDRATCVEMLLAQEQPPPSSDADTSASAAGAAIYTPTADELKRAGLRLFEVSRVLRAAEQLRRGGSLEAIFREPAPGESLGDFLTKHKLQNYAADLERHGLLWGDLPFVSEQELLDVGLKQFHAKRLRKRGQALIISESVPPARSSGSGSDPLGTAVSATSSTSTSSRASSYASSHVSNELSTIGGESSAEGAASDIQAPSPAPVPSSPSTPHKTSASPPPRCHSEEVTTSESVDGGGYGELWPLRPSASMPGGLSVARRSAGSAGPTDVTLRELGRRIQQQCELAPELSMPEVAEQARKMGGLSPAAPGTPVRDNLREICDHLGLLDGVDVEQAAVEVLGERLPPEERLPQLQAALDAWQPGRWTLKRALGHGGDGVVVLGECRDLSRSVAIKFISQDSVGQDVRLEREAKLLQRAPHPYICQLYEFSMRPKGLFCMCLEYMDGGSVQDMMDKAPGHRIRQYQVLRMAHNVLHALEFMHDQGVIHRDIKPGNIMRTRAADGDKFKVIDFGIAVVGQKGRGSVQETALKTSDTGLRSQIGTVHWMSPEQVSPDTIVDVGSDLWSLGCVIYAALSGGKPFADTETDHVKIGVAITTIELVPLEDMVACEGVISDGVSAFVSKALTKARSNRFQSARDMIEKLEFTVSTASVERDFDVYLSCNAVAADQRLIDALVAKCYQQRLANGAGVVPYVDNIRLIDAQRYDEDFVQRLCRSSIFTPLISVACLQRCIKISSSDEVCDGLLTEWLMALELKLRGTIKAIMPIVLGRGDVEALCGELRDGHMHGQPLPDIVPRSTTDKARELLRSLGGSIELSRELTVKACVMALFNEESCFVVQEQQCDPAFEPAVQLCTERIDALVVHLRTSVARSSSTGSEIRPHGGNSVTGNQQAVSEHRFCIDRPFVQKEIRRGMEAKKNIITVFEDDRRKQGYFDYGEAYKKYAGTEWESLLHVDATTYRRDAYEAQAMLAKIKSKSKRAQPRTSTEHIINQPGHWDYFLSHGQGAAGDQVKALSMLLKESGASVWYDMGESFYTIASICARKPLCMFHEVSHRLIWLLYYCRYG
jgi:serine/threonine protein kinase